MFKPDARIRATRAANLYDNGENIRRMFRIVVVAFAIVLTGCTSTRMEISNMSSPITAESVIAFLHRFEALGEKEDFALIREMIDENAYFRFNDGDFIGRAPIQAVFEKTWRGDPSVKKARFYLTDIVVLTVDSKTATATYTYNWEGSQGGKSFTIRGRGTRVLAHENGEFKIVHEHLSRFPKS